MSRFYLGGFLLALAVVGGGAARQSRRFGTQSANSVGTQSANSVGIQSANSVGTQSANSVGIQSANCGCQCSPMTLQDKYGRIIGNCLSSYKGSLWCYVDSWTSPCTDLRKSSKTRKPWSYQACVTPVTNLCSNSVGPVGPTGLPNGWCVRNEDCKGQVFDGVWACKNNKCEVQPLCLFGNCQTGTTEIPFPSKIKCRPDEEHLPGDPGCCRKINDHSFIYCI